MLRARIIEPLRLSTYRFSGIISYRRSEVDDQRLAHLILDRLGAAGHEPFIDVGMPIGTDWSAEIDRRIEWCDALIVLLSEHSIHSEMVQGEVRRAYHRRRLDGRPRILPVRVRYDGPLDYELESYLGRLQYVMWNGDADDERILSAILGKDLPTPARLPAPAPVPGCGARPHPSIDPRPLTHPPGGSIAVDDPFYVRRNADDRLDVLASQIGRTVVIKAPRQMGKSSLLIRFIDKCRAHKKAVAYLDFQIFADRSLVDYGGFLGELAGELLYALGFESPEAPPSFSRQQKFIRFMRDDILKRIGSPIVLAFDEVDRVLGRPWQNDFFAMLRSWHNDRATDEYWRKSDLALVIATEPYLLIERTEQSPFNVVPATELLPFGDTELDAMNLAHGAPLNATQLSQLNSLVGGHPYLTRLAFYRLGSSGLTFQALMDSAARDDGPFGDHLRAKLFHLQRNPSLSVKLKQLILHRIPPDLESYWRLHGAGLVASNTNNEVTPSNMLYARFFKDVL